MNILVYVSFYSDINYDRDWLSAIPDDIRVEKFTACHRFFVHGRSAYAGVVKLYKVEIPLQDLSKVCSYIKCSTTDQVKFYVIHKDFEALVERLSFVWVETCRVLESGSHDFIVWPFMLVWGSHIDGSEPHIAQSEIYKERYGCSYWKGDNDDVLEILSEWFEYLSKEIGKNLIEVM